MNYSILSIILTTLLLLNLISAHSNEDLQDSIKEIETELGVEWNNDYNSLWGLKEGQTEKTTKTYKDPIKCGDNIRLEHMLTKKNLHTHKETSPISQNQEVSAYGRDGDGDTADDWYIICEEQQQGESLFASTSIFHLRHKETQKYLRTRKDASFNQRNCGQQCPIDGQLEVSSVSQKSYETQWKITGGLFIEQKQEDTDWDNSNKQDDEQDDNKKQEQASGIDEEGYEEAKFERMEEL